MISLRFKFVFCAVAFVIAALPSNANAQAGTDLGWGLGIVTCDAGIGPIETVLVVHSDTPPIDVLCRDSAGPSASFGDAIVDESGACDNGVNLADVIGHVGWFGCSAPLIGEADAGFRATVAMTGDFVCPSFNIVGEIFAQARAFNFLLGTLVGQGQEGFSNCNEDFQSPIAPAISKC